MFWNSSKKKLEAAENALRDADALVQSQNDVIAAMRDAIMLLAYGVPTANDWAIINRLFPAPSEGSQKERAQ